MKSPRAALDVVGEVRAFWDGEPVRITAQHDVILVDLPKLRPGRAAWRQAGRRVQRQKTMRRVHAALQLTDLSLHFQLAGKTVARLGADAHPGWLSWALGVRPLEVRLSGMLSVIPALFRKST